MCVCVCVFSLGLVVVVVGVAAAGAACSAALMPHDDGHDRHEGLGEHRHERANHVYRGKERSRSSAVVQEGSGVDDGNALPIAAGAAGAVVAAAGGEVVVEGSRAALSSERAFRMPSIELECLVMVFSASSELWYKPWN